MSANLNLFSNVKINGEGVPEISCEELQKNISHVRMIDVRRPDEFTGELGHIKNADLCTLETHFANSIPSYAKEDVYVFICRSGMRSSKATAHALSLGFKQVYNLEGGMIAWNAKNLPVQR